MEYERIDSINSTLGSDGLPHGSGISRRTEDIAISLTEAGRRYNKALLDAQKKMDEVLAVIDQVEGIYGVVLYERYIRLSKWQAMADELCYSLAGLFKIHGKALGEVERIINNESDRNIL